MALTVKDLIYQAREVVQDLGMEYDFSDPDRHSDEKLIRYLNTALADCYRLRPDLFFPLAQDRQPVQFTTDDITNSTPWPLEPGYWSAFVDYVAGYVGLGDDEFAQEGRAVTLLNRFSQKLLAKGA